jgi:hypothetical protein
MKKETIDKQALDLIFAVVTVITNYRLYPPASTIVTTTMNRLNRMMRSILEQTDRLEYAEADRNLLIQGEPVPGKELGKNFVRVFLRMMLDYGIRSISFYRGVSEQELNGFVKMFTRSAGDVEADGGPAKIVSDLGFTNIKIDEKVYVELDSERRMVASMNLTDEDIVRFIVGEEAFSEAAREQAEKLVMDAEWILRVFQAGIKQVVAGSHGIPADMSDKLAGMIHMLSRISGMGKTEVSSTLLESLPKMESESLLAVMTQDFAGIFGESDFNRFVEEMDEDAFLSLLNRVKDLAIRVSEEEGHSDQQVKAVQRAFQVMTASRKAAGLFSLSQLQALKNKVIPAEDRMARGMDKTIEMLMAKGNLPSVMMLIERLGQLLRNKDPKLRSNALKMLLKVDKQLEAAGRQDQRIHVSRQLTQWLHWETVLTPDYGKIADQAEKMARHLLETDNPADAEPILEAYYKIFTGQLPREKEMRLIAGKLLRNLATDDLLNLLISETRMDGAKKQTEGIPALGMLGLISIERLLNRLHDTQNRLERNRIIQALTFIGRPAAKPIVERLLQKGPWYYMRNLILVLGRTGSEVHLKVLADMLEDDDPRLQREAVFAIQNIAGSKAGGILMKYLYSVDDEVKELLILHLGITKHQPAVPELIAMLDEKTPGKTRKTTDDIRIKLCEALGRIGDPAAAPALKKIIRSKSFLAIKAHHPAVRAAAAEALAKLKSAKINNEHTAPKEKS